VVLSLPVLAFSDSSTSHCLVTNSSTALHSTLICMNIQWGLAQKVGIILFRVINVQHSDFVIIIRFSLFIYDQFYQGFFIFDI